MESWVRSWCTLKISLEGKLKIIPWLVRTGNYRYKIVQVYEYKLRKKRLIDQKGANTGQVRLERCWGPTLW